AVFIQSKPDMRLRLEGVPVKHLGLPGDRAHVGELPPRRDVEGRHPRFRQRLKHHLLAVGLDRISRLAGKHRHELPAILLQHLGAKAIDGIVGTKRERCFAGILESLQRAASSIFAASLTGRDAAKKTMSLNVGHLAPTYGPNHETDGERLCPSPIVRRTSRSLPI